MRQLPIIAYKRKRWFLDERLRQIRNIKNPHDFIDLNPLEIAAFKIQLAVSSGEARDPEVDIEQTE